MLKSGILLHISSLPNRFSVGSLGEESYRFVDLLAELGFDYWQMLPINPTDEENSPYNSPDPFCGNPFFLDLTQLCKQGIITERELALQEMPNKNFVDYSFADSREDFLEKVFARVANSTNVDEISKAIQNEFWRQWAALKRYANAKGIELIGDIPFYISRRSMEVQLNTNLFKLDTQGGAPPDYFAKEGQAWSSPTYNWNDDGIFDWWVERLALELDAFDRVRIDHFRGLVEYWELPVESENGIPGKWVAAQPNRWFDAIKQKVNVHNLIAEDLGEYSSKVRGFLKKTGIPSMRVMQFGFETDDMKSEHKPHNYPKNCVAYTGTHDNNTTFGFVSEASNDVRTHLAKYCGVFNGDNETLCRGIYRELFRSKAETVILPMQDVLFYGKDARMNIPGQVGWWIFRLSDDYQKRIDKEFFKELNYYRKEVW